MSAADLLADQRAKDLLAADPGVVNSLVAIFREVAAQAQATAAGLRGAAGDATWSGAASDAFRQGLGKLPDDLGKVTQSYQEAADALGAFDSELSYAKPKLQSILDQINQAQSHLAATQSQLAGAQNSLQQAQAKASAQSIANPLSRLTLIPMNSPLQAAVDSATGAVSNAQGEIDGLTSQGFRVLDEFSSARGTAQGRVSSASNVPPHRSFWGGLFHDLGNWMSDAGHFLVNVGAAIIHPVLDLPHAIVAFAQDRSLENLGKLAEDVGGTALLVATVVAPFAAPELLAADGAAAGTAGAEGVVGAADAAKGGLTLQSIVDGANTTARISGTASGYANVIQDLRHGNLAATVVDGGFMLLPEASNLAGVGDNAVQQAENSATAWGKLQNAVNNLPDSSAVKGVLSDVASTGKTSAEQLVAQARYNADRSGQILNYGADQAKQAVQKPLDKAVGAPHGEPAASACGG